MSAALLSAPSAWAGHPQTRQGFWIGCGAGYGSASASADCEDCGGGDVTLTLGRFTGTVTVCGPDAIVFEDAVPGP